MQSQSPEETLRVALRVSHTRLRRQHELVVSFGVASLRAHHLDDLLTDACVAVAKGMNTQFAKILIYQSDESNFVLYKGVGWAAEDIGHATVGADDASPAGFAYSHNRPVISNHLGDEHRFRTPALLQKYGIERAINVPIRGLASAPYGVLEADSTQGDAFIESDLVFMEGIANVISMAVERLLTQGQRAARESYSENVLNCSPDCIKVLSVDGKVEFINESGAAEMELEPLQTIIGVPWASLWLGESRVIVESAVAQAAQGNTLRFEALREPPGGQRRWWDTTVAPITDPDGRVERLIAVSRDVSERHAHEEALQSLIKVGHQKVNESVFALEEIHHRVRNSLQLVNTLLLLQANLANDESVKSQLKIAAHRVLTIASVHQRLYQNPDSGRLEPSDYLTGLIEDIRNVFGERPIELNAVDILVPSDRLAALGLVISELVTNAVKYGAGQISVSLEQQGSDLMIVVTDEGNGFPSHYPVPQGTGLGMRLVRNYAGHGEQSIEVDRSVAYSRIVVRFKV